MASETKRLTDEELARLEWAATNAELPAYFASVLDAVAEIRERRAIDYDYVQTTIRETLDRFTASGFGRIGEPNTLWAMTRAACDEVDQLRAEVRHFRDMHARAAADNAARAERDACQLCLGHKGGTPGNENRLGAPPIVVCDFCTSLLMDAALVGGGAG